MLHHPTEIKLRKTTKVLEIGFSDGKNFALPFEYLRVFSPSAEVRGHGKGQEVLQFGKQNIDVQEIEPIGNYAVRLIFDDGHNSGIYSWDVLYDLGMEQSANWKNYLEQLTSAGRSRSLD